MRLLNWNIGHGGGTRIPAICRHIEHVSPELLALTEFQTRNESSLRAHFEQLGYPFIATSNPPGNRNGILVASKRQLESWGSEYVPDTDSERWLSVRLEDLDLDVLALHIPGAPDNKFEDGYGISGARRKELFWEAVLRYAHDHRDRRAVIMGDFNTGLRIDAEGAMFKKSHFMVNLINAGFVDAFRHLHPQARQYTWYSKRKDKITGRSEDLNGFRLDYIFVSSALKSAIVGAEILQEPRKAGASDHASVVANIKIHGARTQPEIVRIQDVPDAPEQSGPDDPLEFASAVEPPARTVAISGGNRLVRFDLASGSLPDMPCGVNGQAFVQEFRPTHFTAE